MTDTTSPNCLPTRSVTPLSTNPPLPGPLDQLELFGPTDTDLPEKTAPTDVPITIDLPASRICLTNLPLRKFDPIDIGDSNIGTSDPCDPTDSLGPNGTYGFTEINDESWVSLTTPKYFQHLQETNLDIYDPPDP